MVTTDASLVPMPEKPVDWDALPKVGIGWEVGMQHGWGIHGYYLAKRMVERRVAVPLIKRVGKITNAEAQPLLVPVSCSDFKDSFYPMIFAGGNMPTEDFGRRTPHDMMIHVFENPDFTAGQIDYLKSFEDRIITVSQWCSDVLRSEGIPAKCVHLGVDTAMFKPRPRGKRFGEGRFVIFSGGKAELRKGQDIVLAAFKIFQERHREALLVTMWHNHWPATTLGLHYSPYIHYWPFQPPAYRDDPLGIDPVLWARANGVSADMHEDLGVLDRDSLASLMCSFDVALFPNRCEGGTNMVAMECLASGVPTILSDVVGHRDLIMHPVSCYALEQSPTCTLPGSNASWGEPSVDECVEALEYVYAHQGEARNTGIIASEVMQSDWDWSVRMDEQIKALAIGRDYVAFEKAKEATIASILSEPDNKLALEYAAYAADLRNNSGHAKLAAHVARRAYNMAPKDGRIVGQMGNLLITSHHPEAAREYSERAMKLLPAEKDTLIHNVALSLMYAGRSEQALREFAKIKEPSIEAIFDRACCLMLAGRWKEGWQEHEIRRLHVPDHHRKRVMPEWEGQRIGGAAMVHQVTDYGCDGTLWVTCEQGIGDTIMFARYLPWARSRCNRLVFSVYPGLMPIFYGYPGVDEIRSYDPFVPEPEADFHVPMQSLAHYAGTMPDSVPPDPGHFINVARVVQAKLAVREGDFKVGIVWKGAKHHTRDFERSMPVEALYPLIEVPGVQLYSFQLDGAADLAKAGLDKLVSDVSGQLDTWHASLGAIQQLDLLITVDTSVAHAAGVLGVPVWVLICKLPDWRWLKSGDTTPWYPSMTLFRQRKAGVWDDVVTAVRNRLHLLAQGKDVSRR